MKDKENQTHVSSIQICKDLTWDFSVEEAASIVRDSELESFVSSQVLYCDAGYNDNVGWHAWIGFQL